MQNYGPAFKIANVMGESTSGAKLMQKLGDNHQPATNKIFSEMVFFAFTEVSQIN